MQQITDFIPKTAAECRSLLKTLSENRDGLSLANRYGHRENLTADDVKTLIGLIENQIGEKAPANAPEEKTDESPAEQEEEKPKPVKKNNPKAAGK